MDDFFLPRRCLLAAIPEIGLAASLLGEAAVAHLQGDHQTASKLLRQSDMPAIAAWTESIWGKVNQQIIRYRPIQNSPPFLERSACPIPRMPTKATMRSAIARDGYHCRFCGIPVLHPDVRPFFRTHYPQEARWSQKNSEQHAAFQAMWLQFDHVLPNKRGGESNLGNILITCAPCNFGRMDRTLEEVGVGDPRTSPFQLDGTWDGLERLISTSKKPTS